MVKERGTGRERETFLRRRQWPGPQKGIPRNSGWTRATEHPRRFAWGRRKPLQDRTPGSRVLQRLVASRPRPVQAAVARLQMGPVAAAFKPGPGLRGHRRCLRAQSSMDADRNAVAGGLE